MMMDDDSSGIAVDDDDDDDDDGVVKVVVQGQILQRKKRKRGVIVVLELDTTTTTTPTTDNNKSKLLHREEEQDGEQRILRFLWPEECQYPNDPLDLCWVKYAWIQVHLEQRELKEEHGINNNNNNNNNNNITTKTKMEWVATRPFQLIQCPPDPRSVKALLLWWWSSSSSSSTHSQTNHAKEGKQADHSDDVGDRSHKERITTLQQLPQQKEKEIRSSLRVLDITRCFDGRRGRRTKSDGTNNHWKALLPKDRVEHVLNDRNQEQSSSDYYPWLTHEYLLKLAQQVVVHHHHHHHQTISSLAKETKSRKGTITHHKLLPALQEEEEDEKNNIGHTTTSEPEQQQQQQQHASTSSLLLSSSSSSSSSSSFTIRMEIAKLVKSIQGLQVVDRPLQGKRLRRPHVRKEDMTCLLQWEERLGIRRYCRMNFATQDDEQQHDAATNNYNNNNNNKKNQSNKTNNKVIRHNQYQSTSVPIIRTGEKEQQQQQQQQETFASPSVIASLNVATTTTRVILSSSSSSSTLSRLANDDDYGANEKKKDDDNKNNNNKAVRTVQDDGEGSSSSTVVHDDRSKGALHGGNNSSLASSFLSIPGAGWASPTTATGTTTAETNNKNKNLVQLSIPNDINDPTILSDKGTNRTRWDYWHGKKHPQVQWMVQRIQQVMNRSMRNTRRDEPKGNEQPPSNRPFHIVDVGGGRGDLAVALAATFITDENAAVIITVVDIHESSLNIGKQYAMQILGLQQEDELKDRMNFVLADFRQILTLSAKDGDHNDDASSSLSSDFDVLSNGSPVDLVVGLHACGDLSDAAIAFAVQRKCSFVVCPCCFTKRFIYDTAAPTTTTTTSKTKNGNTTTMLQGPAWWYMKNTDNGNVQHDNDSSSNRPSRESSSVAVLDPTIATVQRLVETPEPAVSQRAMLVINTLRYHHIPSSLYAERSLEEFPRDYSSRNQVLIGRTD